MLVNGLVLIFWFRAWSDDERAVVFNPYLAPLAKISDPVLGFIRSALPFHPRVIAALLIPCLLLLRGLAVPPQMDWRIVLGFERQVIAGGVLSSILFSFLSFAVFLFKIWGISLIYVYGSTPPTERAESTIHGLARPFTDIRPTLRPFALLVIGIVIVALMDITGRAPEVARLAVLQASIEWNHSSLFVIAVELSLLALSGWVQLLLVLQQLMIVMIIGSWGAMFMAAPALSAFCRDWMDLLLGPLRRYPMRIGMFDLSPFVFFIGIMVIHNILMGLLLLSYQVLT